MSSRQTYKSQAVMIFENLRRDLLYAIRSLRKNPGFTAIAVLTLALGIGANAAVFTFVNAALLKPAFGTEPDKLIEIVAGERNSAHSYANYLDFRNDSRDVLSGLAAFLTYPSNLVVAGATERVNVGLISDNYFDVFGVKPIVGRTFHASENTMPGAHYVAIISERLWRRQFHSTTDVIGRTALLNGAAYSVVGVVPDHAARMMTVIKNDIFVPAVMQGPIRGGRDWLSVRGNREFLIVGRLNTGVGLDQAQARFRVTASRLQRDYPDAWTSRGRPIPLSVVPYSPVTFELRGPTAGISGVLLAFVGMVLLIACSNLLNFLLARAMTRHREMAIRLALGASRCRLVQQLLTETFLLATVGAGLGLIAAYLGKYALLALTPNFGVPIELDLSLDYRVLGFCLFLVMLTAVVCGLLPALRGSKPDPGPTLKEGSFALTPGPSSSRLRSSLLVAQVATSLVLLLCSGLFVGNIQRLYSIDPGFDSRHVALLSVDLGATEQRRDFATDAVTRLQSLPGVEAVTVASRVPMGQSRGRVELQETGGTESDWFFAGFNNVGLDYFRTMRIPLQRGRAFTPSDLDRPVVIVNEKLARDLWPDQNPLGKQLQTESGSNLEVIGVVNTTTYDQLGEQPMRFVYFRLGQDSRRTMTFHVRTHARPEGLLSVLQRELLAIDSRIAVFDVQTLAHHIADSILPVRLGAILLTVFGGIGLALACVGLYGVMAYVVSQRKREIGIRLALGAKPWTIVMAVLKRGMSLTALGITIGTLIGSGITAVVASEFYSLTPADVGTLVLVVVAQAIVALIACWLPARRAGTIDPIRTFRYE